MDFGPDEHGPSILTLSYYALDREGLLGLHAAGDVERLRNTDVRIPGEGLIYHPSVAGVDLFMWAAGHGRGHTPMTFLHSPLFKIEGMMIPEGAAVIADLPAPAE